MSGGLWCWTVSYRPWGLGQGQRLTWEAGAGEGFESTPSRAGDRSQEP